MTRDDTGLGEPRHLVRGERPARDRDERLRPALRGVAEALGLAAREDQRFHVGRRFRLALGRLGQDVERRDGAADALVGEAGGAHGSRIEQVAPVDDQRVAHRGAHLLGREVGELRPFRDDHRGVGAATASSGVSKS